MQAINTIANSFSLACLKGDERMRNTKEKLAAVALVTLFAISISTLGMASATYTGTFTFKAWIDGSDYVYVQYGGATVWYEHLRYVLPGMQGGNYSSYVDGAAWYPSWSNNPFSDNYTSPEPHPTGEWNITSITTVQARYQITIAEYPSVSNNYTAKIYLNDDPLGGADWYEFTMNWESAGEAPVSYVTRTAWVPPVANGVVASVVTVGAVSAGAIVAAAVSATPVTSSIGFLDKLVDNIRKLLPDTFKKWLESLISSKRKLKIEEKEGSIYLPTKTEIIVYTLSVVILTFSFAYVKVNSLNDFLLVLPTFVATSLIVGLVKTYILTVFARRRGVWTEYKLWYFGVAMFLISTLAFRMPFSSPTRSVNHSKNFTERLGFYLCCADVFITLGFAGIFLVLLNSGFALIGSSGLAMCLIAAFFETLPIKPMGGVSIYKYNKKYWAILFLTTLMLHIIWLAHVV